ncbi:MAG TPA: hypothetical protein VEK38_00080, partial [Candidatus Bathyarchaeia archaeon]|nr:hypothetical protein [Candidatus Bathyarchaeia archaeon]
ILVDDTLQRHTMKLNHNLPIEILYQSALKEGDEWLERNRSFYNRFTIPCKIMRWDHWLNHQAYKKQHEIICNRYLSDQEYHQSFDITIKDFLSRFAHRHTKNSLSLEQSYALCLEYLLEECTALCLWVEEKINFEVYPSRRNAAMSATHTLFIKPDYPDLLLPVAIKFKNRKQLSPQKFLINVK